MPIFKKFDCILKTNPVYIRTGSLVLIFMGRFIFNVTKTSSTLIFIQFRSVLPLFWRNQYNSRNKPGSSQNWFTVALIFTLRFISNTFKNSFYIPCKFDKKRIKLQIQNRFILEPVYIRTGSLAPTSIAKLVFSSAILVFTEIGLKFVETGLHALIIMKI